MFPDQAILLQTIPYALTPVDGLITYPLTFAAWIYFDKSLVGEKAILSTIDSVTGNSLLTLVISGSTIKAVFTPSGFKGDAHTLTLGWSLIAATLNQTIISVYVCKVSSTTLILNYSASHSDASLAGSDLLLVGASLSGGSLGQ
jgi:hypothetical protein